MKKKLVIICFLFFFSYVYGLTSLSEFETLSPEEKVDTLLNEYRGSDWYGLDWGQKASLIAGEGEKTLPYIFQLLKKYDAHPFGSYENQIEILDNMLLLKFFQVGKLNKEEIAELEVIYTELLVTYLKTYKKVDIMASILQAALLKWTKGEYTRISLSWVEENYKLYTELGYGDLTIDYDELRNVMGLQ